MEQVTSNCQNCHTDFTIEPRDFEFYAKIQVPAPTFCPLCRFQRRLMFRNERALYSGNCASCGKRVITTYSPDKKITMYCHECWWTGNWDASSYGRDYDPNRTFFEQFRELEFSVPFQSVPQDYQTLTNSEYTTYVDHLKNCYLVHDCSTSENLLYCKTANFSKDSMDLLISGHSQFCYENTYCGSSSRVFYSSDCTECLNVYFSRDCVGCSDCFGCVNLRNQKYCWFNEQLSKEEYEKRLASRRLDSYSSVVKARDEADVFFKTLPYRFMHGLKNTETTGDYVFNSKKARDIYIGYGCEDCRFCQFISVNPAKDCYDYTEWGANAQRIYEGLTVGDGSDNIKFSWACWRSGTMNLEYCIYTLSSQNMFGCVGMKKKQYCILNKQYSKEAFDALRLKIIADMERNPYVDAKGRVWKYGEFFPYDLAICDYNESTAIQYFPMTREQALANGWRWYDGEKNAYAVTKKPEDLPDSIHDVTDEILKEIIECDACKRAYRIVRAELDLLRNFGLPLPRKCPDCRHIARLARVNKPVFYQRQCMNPGCENSFQTSYAPDRPEIVYCESCYQNEVI